MTEIEAGEPTPETCLRVARAAAALAAAADDAALNAACRSSSRTEAHREEVMHAVHREAVEAEGHAARAEQWAADPSMPDSALRYCATGAVDHAVRAQEAAGVEATAAALRTELERKLTPQEHAERESEHRRAEAEQEAEERAETGMDADNRHLARMNAYLAESIVPALGWTAGHVRVLEAAETGRLYQRDGQVRQAAVHGVWSGGRKVSRERTQDLRAAGYLTVVDAADGVSVLVPAPSGQVALELARLHPAGLYESDKAAYEARYARVTKRHKRMDDKKAAARRLPALDGSTVRRYQRPVTLVEQEARAAREATEQWEDEGGYCPGVETPAPAAESTARCPCCGLRKATVSGVLAPHKPTRAAADDCPGSGLRPGVEPRVEDAPAAAAEPAATPVTAGPSLPPGMYFMPLMSTQYREWWAIQCGRCQGGVRTELPGEWADKYEAAQVAREHYDDLHRPANDWLTTEEIAEVERWPLSAAQRTVLHWAEHAELAEYDDGFWALDCVPDRWDVNKRVARGRVTGMWAAGLLDVHLDGNGRRRLVKSPTGRRVARLVLRAHRQGIADPAPKDARLAALPKRSNGYPLMSEGRYFKGEERRADDPAPTETAPVPAAAVPAAEPEPVTAPVRADQPLLRRLFAPRAARKQRPPHDVRTVVRRPQRILTPEERERVQDMPLLNLQGALIMGITDPVPNASPMPEDAGAWVREHAWPAHFQPTEDRYPFGFHRWSMCERGTCWNCLSGRHDICVHRQKGGPDVDRNRDWVTNHQGRTVAEFIPRPDGEPCVWWCRCECPKDGPAPARPTAKKKPAPAGSPTAPEPASVQAAAPARAPEADAVQAALW
ncbi:DUF6248 family natural product biosynthesis protein [Streptomyces sp. NPDC058469]|uniref:DUF6248 family natural product biosynthesis protein n=1 Tax=Streptomyces sp. NPDC058469 TaxID=3346514 RepID=UPI00365F6E74